MGRDVKWKMYFHDNCRCADLINGVGCGGVQIVKDTDLQEVDTTAKEKSRDILRKVAFGTNFMIVGIENQEEKDYGLPFRTLFYDVADYEKQMTRIHKEVRREKGLESGEYLYGFKKDSKLNPLATFILYAGEEPWNGPNSLHDILDFTDVPEALQNIVSDYKINVIDIRQFENTDVFKTDVKYVFDFIRCSDDRNKLLELVEGNQYFHEMEDDALEVVTTYTKSKELVKAKEYKIAGGKNDVCKAIRDLMDDSREEGREEGRIQNLCNLVAKGLLSMEVALQESRLSKEEFLEEMKELGLDLPN